MKEICKTHWGAIVLAVMIGLASLLPQLYAIAQLGDDYAGVWPIHGSDDLYYGARAQDVIDGHPRLVNPYLVEHKDGEPLQFWIPDYLVTAPLYALGVPVGALHYVFDFVLPLVLALLTYWVGWVLTKRKSLALAMVIFFNDGLFFGLFNRPVSPQFTFVFCLTLIGFVIRFLQTQQQKWLWFIVLNTSFLFYIYTYYWTFFVVAFGLFGVWALWRYYTEFPVLKLIAAWWAGALIGIPYFMQLISSRNLPGYEDTLTRLGMLYTHFPSGLTIVGVGGVLAVVMGWMWFKKQIPHSVISALLISGVVGSVVVTNHHVITGQNLEFSSHYWPIAAFWFGFAGIYCLANLFQKHDRWLPAVLVASVLVALPMMYSAIERQSYFKPEEIMWQRYSTVFEWLNQNTKKDSVVFTNEELSSLIPIHTHNNVFYTRWANLHFMTDQEVWERFVVNHYWDEFSDEFIKENERSIFGTAFINAYGHAQQQNKLRGILGIAQSNVPRYPTERMAEFQKFTEKLKQEPLAELLKHYQVDYIVWDQQRTPQWKLSEIEAVEEVVRFDSIVIYTYGEK